MTAEIVSVLCGGPGFKSPDSVPTLYIHNAENKMTPCEAYQTGLNSSTTDICLFAHDDLEIHEQDWIMRVMALFDNPNCVVVGLGGATSLGRPDLYRKPYRIENMARGGYCSNQTDAEVHGARFMGAKRVAVVDAFFMAVRREWLVSIGGWPVKHLSHHALDLWICCEAARHDKEVWMAGVSCTHHGGGTSTKPIYREAKWLQGGTLESDHQTPHRWLYHNYIDVLPIEVPDVHSMDQRSRAPLISTPARTEETHRMEQKPDKVPDLRPDDQDGRDVVAQPKAPKVNIVMTVRDRPKLTEQALYSLVRNSKWSSLVIVDDGSIPEFSERLKDYTTAPDVDLLRTEYSGHVLGLLKNLGVWWSERRFGRGDYLCILDNDVALFEGWLDAMLSLCPTNAVIGGCQHPYHKTNDGVYYRAMGKLNMVDAVAGYSMFMTWETWDKYGPFDANAPGIGQSEDFAFCQRVKAGGGVCAYVDPPVLAHCGITNSDSKPATGANQFPRVKGLIYE